MFSRLEDILLTQAILSAALLLVFVAILMKRGLFTWNTSGFWTWAAFLLYFFANPLASIQYGLDAYRINLELADGWSRAVWIGFVSLLGMTFVFLGYLSARSRPVTLGLQPGNFKLNIFVLGLMVGFSVLAFYSVFTHRIGGDEAARYALVAAGRFTGNTSGYSYVAHNFIFIPVIFFLLLPNKYLRLVGLALAGVYVVLRLSDPWGRWTIITMLIAISISQTVWQKQRWPPIIYALGIAFLTGILAIRGHTGLEGGSQGLLDIIYRLPDEIGPKLADHNSDMLAFWYLQSYIVDELTGYSYGIPLLNYVFLGFIPSRIFSQKYFLLEWMRSWYPPVVDPLITSRMIGAKWSLLGSYYDIGGVIAVIILAFLTGILIRKLDGMLAPESSSLAKTIGICWMSSLWIIWAGQDAWAFQNLGIFAIPAIIAWFIMPKPWLTFIPGVYVNWRVPPINRSIESTSQAGRRR